MSAPPTGWALWRQAEAKLGTGAIEAAARTLPARQAELLRALHALELGDEASIRGASEATTSLDIRAVLDMARREPETLDPTRERAALKQAGVKNAPYPTLDLLRTLAVGVSCTNYSVRPAALKQALSKGGAARVVLRSALEVFEPHGKLYEIYDTLARRSLRLARVWQALSEWRIGRTGTVAALAAHPSDGKAAQSATFSAERWPAFAGQGDARKRAVALEAWLAAPGSVRFDSTCDALVEAACSAPLEQRRHLLARLLHALPEALRGSHPGDAMSCAMAAIPLSRAIPSLPHRNILEFQLSRIGLSVLALTKLPMSTAAVDALWESPLQFSEEERRHLAKMLVGRFEEIEAPPRHVSELVRIHCLSPENATFEGLRPLQIAASYMPLAPLRQALGKAEVWHRELVLAAFASGKQDLAAQLEHTLHAATAPMGRSQASFVPARDKLVRKLLDDAVSECERLAELKAPEKRALARAIGSWLKALDSGALDAFGKLDAAHVNELVSVARTLASAKLGDVDEALCARLSRAYLELHPSPGAPPEFRHASAALQIGDRALAEGHFSALGRHLRTAPKDAALAAALGWAVELKEALNEPERMLFLKWQKAVHVWLELQPKPLLGQVALRLAQQDADMAWGLSDWADQYLHRQRRTPDWDAIDDIAEEHMDELGSGGLSEAAMEDLARQLLEHFPFSLPEFDGRRRPKHKTKKGDPHG